MYSYSIHMSADLDSQSLREVLEDLGRRAASLPPVELTLVGGSAGLLTGQLPPTRTTLDCDVIRAEPEVCLAALKILATQLAKDRGLSPEWLSDRVAQLDVLPAGWRKRRIFVGTFGSMRIWCVGRLDLLSTKIYAGRMQDRADVLDMKPTAEEVAFVRRYLDQLRVPRRQANLDQVQSAVRFLGALEEGGA